LGYPCGGTCDPFGFGSIVNRVLRTCDPFGIRTMLKWGAWSLGIGSNQNSARVASALTPEASHLFRTDHFLFSTPKGSHPACTRQQRQAHSNEPFAPVRRSAPSVGRFAAVHLQPQQQLLRHLASKEHACRILQHFFHLNKKTYALTTIDDTVIVA
jgi:hypothetical protein